jgi:hypothetical protein
MHVKLHAHHDVFGMTWCQSSTHSHDILWRLNPIYVFGIGGIPIHDAFYSSWLRALLYGSYHCDERYPQLLGYLPQKALMGLLAQLN